MAGGKLRRVREIADIAVRRVLAARQWAKLSRLEQHRFEDMRRFLGVPAEELRVRFAAKEPHEAMAEMRQAIAEMHPALFAQRISAWSMAAEEARLNPERTVGFFLMVRDALHEAGMEHQLQFLEEVHRKWAERQAERARAA